MKFLQLKKDVAKGHYWLQCQRLIAFAICNLSVHIFQRHELKCVFFETLKTNFSCLKGSAFKLWNILAAIPHAEISQKSFFLILKNRQLTLIQNLGKRIFKWVITGLFFFNFVFSKQLIENKTCRWLYLNWGSLDLEVTTPPTEPPQPLPR